MTTCHIENKLKGFLNYFESVWKSGIAEHTAPLLSPIIEEFKEAGDTLQRLKFSLKVAP